MNDWISQFETRIAPFLESTDDLGEPECIRLGKKDPEAYPLIHLYYLRSVQTTFVCNFGIYIR